MRGVGEWRIRDMLAARKAGCYLAISCVYGKSTSVAPALSCVTLLPMTDKHKERNEAVAAESRRSCL